MGNIHVRVLCAYVDSMVNLKDWLACNTFSMSIHLQSGYGSQSIT